MPLLFAEDLGAATIHVQAPTPIIFLCGGQCSAISVPTPISLRDAFFKIIDHPALKNPDFVRAEDITSKLTFFEHYPDLLQFETDLAQITELIILFAESDGSIAELGAFSMVDEIASRLLVIVRDHYWKDDSFIKLGPLRRLENEHGRTAVFVIDDEDIGMGKSAAGVKIEVLKDRLQLPMKTRLAKSREPTTFDHSRAGHMIKLVVGLVQEYGALTPDEIQEALIELGLDITTAALNSYLFCGEAVHWIVKRRKGFQDFYIARNLNDAVKLAMGEFAKEKNRARRRVLIREHWQRAEPLRMLGIKEVFGGKVL